MKTDLKKILSVSEHPGLYLYISETKNGIIAEAIADKRRTCLSPRVRMTSLSDIMVYTESGEIKLRELFDRIKALPAEVEVPPAKSEQKLLCSFFEQALPDYDRERFYASHMKKVVEWFRQLRENDMLDFEEEEGEEEKEGVEVKGEVEGEVKREEGEVKREKGEPKKGTGTKAGGIKGGTKRGEVMRNEVIKSGGVKGVRMRGEQRKSGG
ncbi:MAG: DUF5606 domain-containing protein [Prevotellaceae bacterium]|jgi:uncharacterized protein YdaT|nr:DUF5606 domain-containing protein [Prevotellaceae bacterium]